MSLVDICLQLERLRSQIGILFVYLDNDQLKSLFASLKRVNWEAELVIISIYDQPVDFLRNVLDFELRWKPEILKKLGFDYDALDVQLVLFFHVLRPYARSRRNLSNSLNS